MSYRSFQKEHPNWPKRMADVVGRLVCLKRDMLTHGGALFKAGQYMDVTSVSQGSLHLREDYPVGFTSGKKGIRHVCTLDVELVDRVDCD